MPQFHANMSYPSAAAPLRQKILQPEELVNFARQHSPYYAQLYHPIPQRGWRFSELPLVDPSQYWKNNLNLQGWSVLTGPVSDAIVFKTGGTTGSGKLSVYTRSEWLSFVTTFGRSIASQLQPGDRIANLFFAGDLYASFLFIHGALTHMTVPVCEYPFTGAINTRALLDQTLLHNINVLAGVPAMLLHYAAELEAKNQPQPNITTLLYGGESLFTEQRQLFKRVFPNARIASIGCASVDAGLIGAGSFDCRLNEHRSFAPETLVEIIDEVTGETIREPHRPGILVVTNLTRTLMPVIRYPVGDLAAWVEPDISTARKFIILGRSGLGHRVRVGCVTLCPDELAVHIKQVTGSQSWQLLIEQTGNGNQLTLRIAFPGDIAQAQALINRIKEGDETFTKLEQLGQLTLSVQWCQQADLTLHPRTGKLQRIVDRRHYHSKAEDVA